MILLVYFGLLLVVFALRRSPAPALMLIAIYSFSLICGVLIGYDYQVSTFFEGFNLLFIAVMLTLLITSWNAFPYTVALADTNDKRVRRLTVFLVALHSVSFVIFSLICYYAFTTISDYSAFKNDGGSGSFHKDLPINHTLHVLAVYLNPTAAFLIPLFFYHLVKRRFLLSILSLTLSLNIVLEGISIFSRSTLIFYFVLYFFYLPFFYAKFDRKQRRVLSIVTLAFLTLCGAIFYEITSKRFSTYFSHGDARYSQSSIQSPELYSLLDYASHWYGQGNYVMARYSFQTLNGELSFPIVPTIANKLGLINYPPETVPNKLSALWGDRFDKFVGLIPNLVFDFGYIGATLFVLLYCWLLRILRPVRRLMSVATLLMLGPMFALPAMGIQNSLMKTASYNLLILYSMVVYTYVVSRRKV